MGSEDNGGNVLARDFGHKMSDGTGTGILEDESRVSLNSTRICVPPPVAVVIDGVHSTSIPPYFAPISNLIDSMCSLVMTLSSLSVCYTSPGNSSFKRGTFLVTCPLVTKHACCLAPSPSIPIFEDSYSSFDQGP